MLGFVSHCVVDSDGYAIGENGYCNVLLGLLGVVICTKICEQDMIVTKLVLSIIRLSQYMERKLHTVDSMECQRYCQCTGGRKWCFVIKYRDACTAESLPEIVSYALKCQSQLEGL